MSQTGSSANTTHHQNHASGIMLYLYTPVYTCVMRCMPVTLCQIEFIFDPMAPFRRPQDSSFAELRNKNFVVMVIAFDLRRMRTINSIYPGELVFSHK
jgi:hypothetical protein